MVMLIVKFGDDEKVVAVCIVLFVKWMLNVYEVCAGDSSVFILGIDIVIIYLLI